MRAAEVLGPVLLGRVSGGSTGLPEELSGPVGHDPRWTWLAVALLVLAVGYVVVVLVATRTRRAAVTPVAGVAAETPEVEASRRAALAALAALLPGRRAAADPRRVALGVSEIVRAHAAVVTGLPTEAMTAERLAAAAAAEPRLAAAARLVADVQDPAFGAAAGDLVAQPDLVALRDRAAAVVEAL
ncbi:hypothetical protein [Nocardioides sp. GY 10127]|uniref:hypothetical protein n=1 Tax=Nocardioides sp. GY 10127 TaxID=2569762 RepID=UPI0010A7EBE3|nr:hypothetical protein [Nocardioides sp. GY 10127]TIC78934.1 hypothetical protein E8D37_18845 [Nocardioides sp. GY 10127]